MVFHWRLSDSKYPQVSRTLLSILAYLNNAVIWMFSIFPLISRSSSPPSMPLGTIPSTPTTIGITVIFMFHIFFYFPNLSIFLLAFIFTLWSTETAISTRQVFCLFLLFTPWEFFPSTNADGLSRELKWQNLLESPGLFSLFWPISIVQ